MDKRFEIIYYADDGKRRCEYHSDERDVAKAIARILKDELGYFPVVVYDTIKQDWVDV